MATRKSIASEFILAQASHGQPAITKRCKDAEKKANEWAIREGAENPDVRSSKPLFDSALIKHLLQPWHRFNTWHMNHSREYVGRGPRLIPAKLQPEHSKIYRECLLKFQQQVAAEWVPYVDTFIAQRQRALGPLFSQSDYPDAETLKSAFWMQCKYTAIQDPRNDKSYIGQFGEALRRDLEASIVEAEQNITRKFAADMKQALLEIANGERMSNSKIATVISQLGCDFNITGNNELAAVVEDSRAMAESLDRRMAAETVKNKEGADAEKANIQRMSQSMANKLAAF